jgi:hypothetical protein
LLILKKKIKRRVAPETPKAPLLMSDNSLNPLLVKIFKELFNTYASPDGTMNIKNLAEYMGSCIREKTITENHKVKEIMKAWDKNEDQLLEEDDFLNFYRDACQKKPKVVWDNLEAHQIGKDLKKISDRSEDIIEVKSLPRYAISRNPHYLSLIFEILGKKNKIILFLLLWAKFFPFL